MINVGIIGTGIMGAGHARFIKIGASHRGPLSSINIDFESFSSIVISPDLSSTLGIWRNLWTDNKSMAKSAREYIENKIIAAHKN